ncbi:Histone transcription regulator 3, partial [Kickxella alabastrina]
QSDSKTSFGSPLFDLSALRNECGYSANMGEALEQLSKAARLGKCDGLQYLMIGQCAMALGQLDVAVSAFSKGLEGQNVASTGASAGNKRRMGPMRWWCAQELVRAALMRGDAEMARGIVDNVAAEWPDMARALSHTLNQLVGERVILDSGRFAAEPVLRVGIPLWPVVDAAADAAHVPYSPGMLRVASQGKTVGLVALVEAVLDAFERCVEDGDGLHVAVPYEIDIVGNEPSSSSSLGLGLSPKPSPMPISRSASGSSNSNITIRDGKAQGKRAAVDIDAASGDEIPVKRRSTRFLERATTVATAGLSTMGGSNIGLAQQQQNSQHQHVLALCAEPFDSDEFEQARDAAGAWLEATGETTTSEFAAMCEAAALVAVAAGKERELAQKASARRGGEDKGKNEWGLGSENSSCCGKYGDSLRALLRGREHDNVDITDYVLEENACRALLFDNSGALDLLVRVFRLAVTEFKRAPHVLLASARVRQVLMRVLSAVHEALADAATRDGDAWSATLAVLLLGDANSSSNVSERDANLALHPMREDWMRVADGHSDDDDSCGSWQLKFAEAWTSYEAAALADDAAHATALVVECQALLAGRSIETRVAARCALSGAPVTADVVRQRQAHAAAFAQLALAEQKGDNAINILTSLLAPGGSASELAFAQHIQAARLLVSLERQRVNRAGEARALALELGVFAQRLVSGDSNEHASGFPAHAVVARCVACLREICTLLDNAGAGAAEAEAGVRTETNAAALVALALAFARHFALQPPAAVVANTSSTEATFVPLALWLAAKKHCLTDSVVFLAAAHELLGSRGLCTTADGVFLRHVLAASVKKTERTESDFGARAEAAACLRCLFDIRVHGSDVVTHACLPASLAMDVQSADAACRLLAPELRAAAHSQRGTGLRGDLKAIIDRAAEVLGAIDTDRHPRLSRNTDAIDAFLDGPDMPSFAEVHSVLAGGSEHRLPLSTAEPAGGCICAADCHCTITAVGALPAALLTLPFVRAATQHDVLRFRMRSGMPRAVEDYDTIIDDYKLNLALLPRCADAWMRLGQAYADLADELLLGTATEVIDCRHDIASLQRLALSCAVQVSQNLPRCNRDLAARTVSFAGRLLYRIAARPLPDLALTVLPANVVVDEDNEDSGSGSRPEWDLGSWSTAPARLRATSSLARSLARRYTSVPPPAGVFSLARTLLARAARLDPTSWKCTYMLAKATAKIADPLTACALYLKACHLAASSSFSAGGSASSGAELAPAESIPESAYDALYKLLVTLAKLLHAARVSAATVQRFLDALPFGPARSLEAEPKLECAASAAPAPTPAAEIDSGLVYARIRALTAAMCTNDKRRWNHRPVYLLAWVDHRILGHPEPAKQALLSLLQMRSANKQLATFYKAEFEAPGKHYLYLEKYLHLYIETLVATADLEGARLLSRKLGRSSDSLYNPPALAARAAAAEVAVLQAMVRRLNCPKIVVDALGAERIMLQDAIGTTDSAHVFSITRRCSLSRPHFRAARDHARDNISYFTALREHLKLQAADTDANASRSEANRSDIEQANCAIDNYLAPANQALALFADLLEKRKKHANSLDIISTLSDCASDLFILLLSLYGPSRRAARLQAALLSYRANSTLDLPMLCRIATASIIGPRLDPGLESETGPQPGAESEPRRPDVSFWQAIVFDPSRHDPSQHYKLLDPLLDFQVSKLIDCARDARALQPNPFADTAYHHHHHHQQHTLAQQYGSPQPGNPDPVF